MIFGTECGYSVVEIHEEMDEGVQHRMKCSETTGNKSNAEPPTDRHDAVMENVEHGDLSKILFQDEENRVEQLDEFREEKQMANANHLEASSVG